MLMLPHYSFLLLLLHLHFPPAWLTVSQQRPPPPTATQQQQQQYQYTNERQEMSTTNRSGEADHGVVVENQWYDDWIKDIFLI